MLAATDLWKTKYPGANIGFMLLSNVLNSTHNEVLEMTKQALENELRSTFTTREALLSNSQIAPYISYYKHFKKTYHVLQQLESVIFKGKHIPSVASLVECMFMAELKNNLLTAGHDYEALKLPLEIDVAAGHEQYTLINNKVQTAKSGDMVIKDAAGVISSIIHGPDARTSITSTTKNALFIIYGPKGISEKQILDHLSDIYTYAKMVAPDAKIETQEICSA